MKASIDVASRREAELIRAGLEDPATRAFVKVVAVLQQLPTNRSRARVLHWVADNLAEQKELNGNGSEPMSDDGDRLR